MKFKKLLLKNSGNFCIVDATVWHLIKDFYLREHQGYAYIKHQSNSLPLHRLISMAPKNKCVDHINRNRLDNRLHNLRLCSRQANTFNTSIASNNSSGFKGVAFHRKNKRWTAYIGKNPKTYLGSFKNKEDAARAYNLAAKERFGLFASFNRGV